jgi:DNA-binding transcriptional ArsR family regulator
MSKVSLPHPVGQELAELVAQRFRVLADPTRIRLLDRLKEGPATVGELHELAGGSQQNVSKHLGVLHGAGLVTRTREGSFARYEIADESVFELCDLVCGGVERQLGELSSLLHGEGGSG